jgi:hypothetical protein
MDDRRIGQHAVGPRRVVVGHHDVHARGPGRGDLVDRRDRAIRGEQQVRAARGESLDRGHRQAVAGLHAARKKTSPTSAPSVRSTRIRIAEEQTPSTS